jgi:hypothetical protein
MPSAERRVQRAGAASLDRIGMHRLAPTPSVTFIVETADRSWSTRS